jgi:hypothetical protein
MYFSKYFQAQLERMKNLYKNDPSEAKHYFPGFSRT